MKTIFSLLSLSLMLTACEKKVDDTINEAFERNSQTTLTNLKNYENEQVDYSHYADNFVMRGTAFGDQDSISLGDLKQMDAQFLDLFDLKIVSDTINLLPGVHPESREMDGSVRYYLDWEVTLSATDSTEAKSGIIKIYESLDFNEEGKIVYQQGYGDFSGLMMYLLGGDPFEGEQEEGAGQY